jgi:HAD superfamily hydrolase (TIGR01509 family)
MELKLTPSSAILMDLDGTLVDSVSIWNDTKRQFVEQFNRVPDLQFNEELTGLPVAGVVARIKEHYHLAEPLEYLYPRFDQLIMKRLEMAETIPGVEELIADLVKLKVARAIVSNSNHRMQDVLLRNKAWAAHIPIRISADDVSTGKPEPEIYVYAAEKLKVSPKDCFVIEDSLSGVKAAVQAGMTCLAVTNGVEQEKSLFSEWTPHVFERLGEVRGFLKDITQSVP